MWLNDIEWVHLYRDGWKYQDASSLHTSSMFTSHINTPHAIPTHTLDHVMRFSLFRHQLPLFPVFSYNGDMIFGRAYKDDVIGCVNSCRCCARHVFTVVFFHLELLFPFFRLSRFCLIRFLAKQFFYLRPKNHFYRLRSRCRSYRK